jgi:hypothetical protein
MPILNHYPLLQRVTACIFILVLTCLSGCARLPVVGTLPAGVVVTRLTRVDPMSPFAWNPAGTKIALVSGTLQIYDPASDSSRPLGPAPSTLDWAFDGEHLAAAFPQGEDTTLRILNMDGEVLSEAGSSGHVTKLVWRSADELLIAAITAEKFSFGANIKGILYRWSGIGKPAATILSETTVRPFIAKWPVKSLDHTLTIALSPLGDEIVFSRLIDPPAFSPSLKIVLRHLESGAEKEAAKVGVASAGAVYSADGERILYGDGITASHWRDPWGERELATFPSPGRAAIALSPANRYALIDGRLYRDGSEVVVFPATCEGAFAPGGGRLLIRYDGNLYLVSGLHEAPLDSALPVDRGRLLTLRKLRSEGLISASDYQAAKERMFPQ